MSRYLGPDHQVAPLPCPHCGKVLDGATAVDPEGDVDPAATPQQDSISVCMKCSQVMVMRAGRWAKMDRRLWRKLPPQHRRLLARMALGARLVRERN